jgi:molybdopterin synthase catalytic subunit
MAVRIVNGPFDPQGEQAAFVAGRTDAGALVGFVGYCRDKTSHDAVDGLFLDHYSPFTENEIGRILKEVGTRYELLDALVIHRVGMMKPGDPIVLVAALSPHRNQAFEAVRILMDYLKTDAPLWKREDGPTGRRWIEPSADDRARRAAAERGDG